MSSIPTDQVDRLLPGEPAQLALTPQSSAGELYDLEAPASFEVFDGAGESVIDELAAVSTDGHFLTADIAAGALIDLDDYEVVWTAVLGAASISWSSTLQICGGHIVSLRTMRSHPSAPEMADADAQLLARARLVAEMTIEHECGVAFVPRGARVTCRGSGTPTLRLPHIALREVLGISIRETPSGSAVAMTVDELAALDQNPAGMLTLAAGVWDRSWSISAHYTHGWDAPPADVSGEACLLAVELAKPSSGIDLRATSQTIGDSTYRITVAGRDGATGIPSVDAMIARRNRSLPAVG